MNKEDLRKQLSLQLGVEPDDRIIDGLLSSVDQYVEYVIGDPYSKYDCSDQCWSDLFEEQKERAGIIDE